MEDLIFKLTNIFYIKDNNKVLSPIIEELSKYAETKIYENGNIIGTLGNKKSKNHIMLDAHIDQIGLVVTNILENGFLKVASCGGVDSRILPGSTLKIYGKKVITGIVCSTPPHLIKNKDNKYLKVDELYVDTGLSSEEAKQNIPLYSYIGFDNNPQKLLNNKITAPALDNRAGVAALIYCAKILSKSDLDLKVSIVLSSGEETTTVGAKTASFDLFPQESIAVDVSFAADPNVSKENKGILGSGPMIGFAPSLSKEISQKLIKISKKNDIPYQYEIMGGKTGTNADEISITKSGIKTGLVSIPIRYMHTPIETADISDIKNTAKLLALYIKKGGCLNE